MLTWALQRARQGDAKIEARIKRALTLMAATMVDKATGAMNQVNLKPDWVGAGTGISDVRAGKPGFRPSHAHRTCTAIPAIGRPPTASLVFSKPPWPRPAAASIASFGMSEGEPGVDRRQYARETAQAIAGLLAYYDATGVAEARELAIGGARWALANRALPGGGFRHAEQDGGGPYFADNIEMAKALLALHRSTGGREWLVQAQATADFIAKTFVDPATGGFIASASPDASLPTRPIKQREDNVTAVRMFSLLSSYTGEIRYREIAEAGMGYLTSPPILDAFGFLPDVLLAEDELRNEPVHITIVGAKDDPRSVALFKAALAYPLVNKRAEWWDKREGKLRQYRCRLSGLPRWTGSVRLHSNVLLLSRHGPRRDSGSTRRPEACKKAIAASSEPQNYFQKSPRRVHKPATPRAKLPPYCWSILRRSIFAEWGLKSKRILVAGRSE